MVAHLAICSYCTKHCYLWRVYVYVPKFMLFRRVHYCVAGCSSTVGVLRSSASRADRAKAAEEGLQLQVEGLATGGVTTPDSRPAPRAPRLPSPPVVWINWFRISSVMDCSGLQLDCQTPTGCLEKLLRFPRTIYRSCLRSRYLTLNWYKRTCIGYEYLVFIPRLVNFPYIGMML